MVVLAAALRAQGRRGDALVYLLQLLPRCRVALRDTRDRGRASILGRPLHVIDDQDMHRFFSRHKLQSPHGFQLIHRVGDSVTWRRLRARPDKCALQQVSRRIRILPGRQAVTCLRLETRLIDDRAVRPSRKPLGNLLPSSRDGHAAIRGSVLGFASRIRGLNQFGPLF